MGEIPALIKCKAEIDSHWETNNLEDRCLYLAEGLLANHKKMQEIRSSFHQWSPLKVYTSWTDSSNLEFSLRFKGQKVAVLEEGSEGAIFLRLDPKVKRRNNDCFEFGLSEEKVTRWGWQSPEAKEFRDHFKEKFNVVGEFKHINSTSQTSEAHVESLVIEEMIKTDSMGKFSGTLHGLQPVFYSNAPFQFPVPISSNKGIIKVGDGNIDVLARVTRARLSVWELKRPHIGLGSKAHIQAYAYALALIKMLRSAHCQMWYKDVLGYSGKVPRGLTIEAVPAFGEIAENRQLKIIKELEEFICANQGALQIGNDRIEFKLVFYVFPEGDHKLDPRSVEISKAYKFLIDAAGGSHSVKAVEIGPQWSS